jgi:hypothetical protein
VALKKEEMEKAKRLLMRQAQTSSTMKYTPGGILKKYPPRKVTLPKLKCLSNPEKE